MRRPRIKARGAGYYHCMSRIIERRFIIGDLEKNRILNLMRNLAAFGGLEILAYCLMSNHFHVLVHVPEKRDISDSELVERLAFIKKPKIVKMYAMQLQKLRETKQDRDADILKSRFTYRMYDISQFFKALKQQFSQSYNVSHGRSGPLWEQRFKSILVEGSENALFTMAAYIDLNPVRAGLVADPKDYRFSSYGAAVGGSKQDKSGLTRLLDLTIGGSARTWTEAQSLYRKHLYVQGGGKTGKNAGQNNGFSPEAVQKVIEEGGLLPLHTALRCRVRYFSDGLALGRKEFLEEIFHRYRSHFGPKRQTGSRPLRFADWGGLCSLRDLRLNPVSAS